MEPQYLIDTNAIIDYLGKKLSETGMAFMNNIINQVPNVSIISRIEVLGFEAPEEHYKVLTAFMNDAVVLNINSAAADISIDIRKKHKVKLPDAIIAATALANNLILITGNTHDFKNIKELQIVNAHDI